MQSKGYVKCSMDSEEEGKKELRDLRGNGTGDLGKKSTRIFWSETKNPELRKAI